MLKSNKKLVTNLPLLLPSSRMHLPLPKVIAMMLPLFLYPDSNLTG